MTRLHNDGSGLAADAAAHTGDESPEWPDEDDIDSETEEGRRKMEKADAALMASIKRMAQAQDEECRMGYRGPDKAYEIPKSLYEKAAQSNESLTDEERALLRSRNDAVGRALADPKSLTEADKYEVLRWSAPDVVHAAISRATGGSLSRPHELLAKARTAAERGQLDTLSSEELELIYRGFRAGQEEPDSGTREIYWLQVPGNGHAHSLLMKQEGVDVGIRGEIVAHRMRRSQHAMNEHLARIREEPSLQSAAMTIPMLPAPFGAPQASASNNGGPEDLDVIVDQMEDLQRRRDQGALTEDEFRRQSRDQVAALRRYSQNRNHRAHPYSSNARPARPALPLPTPSSVTEQRAERRRAQQPPDLTRNGVDHDGKPAWPVMLSVQPQTPLQLFNLDLRAKMREENLHFDDFLVEMRRRWDALSPQERAEYDARAERLRQEAWDKWEMGVM